MITDVIGTRTSDPARRASFFIENLLGSDRTGSPSSPAGDPREGQQRHHGASSPVISASSDWCRTAPNSGSREEPHRSDEHLDSSDRGSPRRCPDETRAPCRPPARVSLVCKKKTRTVFSRSQIFQLESTFQVKRYLSSAERSGLAVALQLTETQVKIWFQNRRNKWKRQLAADLEVSRRSRRLVRVPVLYHEDPELHERLSAHRGTVGYPVTTRPPCISVFTSALTARV